jgi:nucleoside-diphosphate-sugar epimerase
MKKASHSFYEGKRFLVTGGTGFIGRALVKSLLEKGAIVRSLDNDSRGSREKLGNIADQIEMVTGDIRDLDVVKKAVHGMDCVCHLAYINGTEFFYTKPELILEVAVKGMMNLLDACIVENVKDFILASSSEVYQTPEVIPTDESATLVVPDVLNPRFSYGGGKIISELLAINYGRKFFNRMIIFRPHNVYGPDMGNEHVVPQFALRMKEAIDKQPYGKIEFKIQGSGEETRSFIFIDDFSKALLSVIEKGKHLNIYHIGTEEEISVKQLATMVANVCDREIEIMPGNLLQGSTSRRCPNTTKLKYLGFEKETNLEKGISQTVKWYLNFKNSK